MPVRIDCAWAQGDREQMEDHHLVQQDKESGWVIAAVCDGHGGAYVSKFTVDALQKTFVKTVLSKGKKATVQEIKAYFKDLDQQILTALGPLSLNCGSTLTMFGYNLETRQFFLVNIGDSRTLLRLENKSRQFIVSTKDHKPGDTGERKRIEAANHFVAAQRVDGCLAVSRALGDFTYKNQPQLSFDKQAVTADPSVYIGTIKDKDTKVDVVLACDGVWDVFSNEQVFSVEVERKKTKSFARTLADLAFANGSSDNLSAVHVRF